MGLRRPTRRVVTPIYHKPSHGAYLAVPANRCGLSYDKYSVLAHD
jgi:hypothetical protein